MSVSERLKQYCKDKKITQQMLVDKGLGSKQTINNYINGNTDPKASFLELFVKEFRLSADWLIIGEGTPGRYFQLSAYENAVVNEFVACKECKEKDVEIKRLSRKLEELQDKLIAQMEELQNKKDEGKCG